MKSKLFLLTAMALVLLASCEKNDPSTTVKDICGNAYKFVTIGSQTWMAENMRCNKYDTESEAYKNGIKSISTSDVKTYAPYYVDASNKSTWETKYGDYSGNLSNGQISKLGYQYNWAAAVGLADGQTQTSAFSGNRQGICPNGWHVPTTNEWVTLATYINDGQQNAKKMKTTSGWYGDGSGTDDYGFSALPAGMVYEITINGVGRFAYFSSASANEKINATTYTMSYDKSNLNVTPYGKNGGCSLRCVKN